MKKQKPVPGYFPEQSFKPANELVYAPKKKFAGKRSYMDAFPDDQSYNYTPSRFEVGGEPEVVPPEVESDATDDTEILDDISDDSGDYYCPNCECVSCWDLSGKISENK